MKAAFMRAIEPQMGAQHKSFGGSYRVITAVWSRGTRRLPAFGVGGGGWNIGQVLGASVAPTRQLQLSKPQAHRVTGSETARKTALFECFVK
jgi:hypothetical protein